jgi:hypothetical protein
MEVCIQLSSFRRPRTPFVRFVKTKGNSMKQHHTLASSAIAANRGWFHQFGRKTLLAGAILVTGAVGGYLGVSASETQGDTCTMEEAKVATSTVRQAAYHRQPAAAYTGVASSSAMTSPFAMAAAGSSRAQQVSNESADDMDLPENAIRSTNAWATANAPLAKI